MLFTPCNFFILTLIDNNDTTDISVGPMKEYESNWFIVYYHQITTEYFKTKVIMIVQFNRIKSYLVQYNFIPPL